MTPKERRLNIERLKALLKYEPETGHFIRLEPVITYNGGIYKAVGSRAGCLSNSDGYRYLQIDKSPYSEHRLAYFYMTGKWPKGQVDHVNGVRDDNRWVNLRDVTRSQNHQNSRGQSSRRGPYPGVYESSRDRGRFIAQIKHRGQVHYLGVYGTPEDAYIQRIIAELKLFGEHAGCLRPDYEL